MIFIIGGGWWYVVVLVVVGGGWFAGGGGRPLETTGVDRDQLPRKQLSPVLQTYSSNAASTPKATLVWGER